MLARVTSCAVVGLEGALVEVEVDIAPGLPAFNIVGLPDAAVQEARERVRAAIRNSGLVFPLKRITVNLAPADLKKEGPAYDLPIAVGIMMSSEQVPIQEEQALFLGELSLDGGLRHTGGMLPMVAVGQDKGIGRVYVPAADAPEAALVDGAEVLPVFSLAELAAHLRGDRPIAPYRSDGQVWQFEADDSQSVDMCHIKGQEHVKRALEIAAAGGHNVVMSGPPGSGKTLLARALPSILPRLTPAEALEVTKIYSVSGLLPPDTPLVRRRPFRSPHYTISHAGLVGGGRLPRPGEISLSHRGVLFLDELPEFGQAGLEVLRQPLEDKVVTISRAQGSVTFPANFMMVGGYEPVPLRLPHGHCEAVHLSAEQHPALPEAHQRPAARPRGHLRRGAARRLREAGGRLPGRAFGGDTGARGGGAGGADEALRGDAAGVQRRDDAGGGAQVL